MLYRFTSYLVPMLTVLTVSQAYGARDRRDNAEVASFENALNHFNSPKELPKLIWKGKVNADSQNARQDASTYLRATTGLIKYGTSTYTLPFPAARTLTELHARRNPDVEMDDDAAQGALLIDFFMMPAHLFISPAFTAIRYPGYRRRAKVILSLAHALQIKPAIWAPSFARRYRMVKPAQAKKVFNNLHKKLKRKHPGLSAAQLKDALIKWARGYQQGGEIPKPKQLLR